MAKASDAIDDLKSLVHERNIKQVELDALTNELDLLDSQINQAKIDLIAQINEEELD